MAKKTIKKKDIGKQIEKKLKKGPKCKMPSCCNGGGFYFLGFLGAVIYYISTATGFWSGVLGVLKALVWPVFLVFELLKFIGA